MNKFKYIKGSHENFIGAPEWAMVAISSKATSGQEIWFAGSYGSGSRVYCPSQAIDDHIENAACWELVAHRVPVAEWDGKGIPPVGAECEFLDNDDIWCKVLIISRNNGLTSAIRASGEFLGYGVVSNDTDPARFRQITTKEDVNREDILRKLTDVICGDVPDVGMVTAYKHAERVLSAIESGKIKLD